MTGVPLLLHGAEVRALVIGGGAVATRRVRALLQGGAMVRVVAISCEPALRTLALETERLSIETREWNDDHFGDAMLIVLATDDRALNARVAFEARAAGLLVNVVDAPEEGNASFPAVHRVEPLVIAVSTGGVPGAAARVRDSIAERFDARYARALESLASLRERMLASGEGEAWRSAWSNLGAAEFCEEVETGELDRRLATWR